MAAAENVPVSELIRTKTVGLVDDDEPRKKSREDWRKAKELEEARKAGTAPAAVDEEGRDINPHIPQYISAAPWYFGSKGPTLRHQRPHTETEPNASRLDECYKRGVDTSRATTKFRKGACENCGAMTHSRRDCMERPRRVGARFSGARLAADEFIQPQLAEDFDGKRDRWCGYDPNEHRAIVEEYHKVEEAKRQLRADKLNAGDGEGEEEGDEDRDGEDEDKYVDEVDMPGTKVDSKQRITVRNLRIREDTAKYLRNLDPASAYYDPKTRSMRDNPSAANVQQTSPNDVDYAGENFVRFSGDTQKHSVAQLFAWEAYEKGVDVHLLAEPTKLEMLQREYDKKKDQFKTAVQGSILKRYGGEEHLEAPPKSLLLAQTEDYVEYSRHGKMIRGAEKQVMRSRYAEDEIINNHTTVWGSYWAAGRWGFKCCHSTVKNSYCTGAAGQDEANELAPLADVASTSVAQVISQEEEAAHKSSESSNDSEAETKSARRERRREKKRKKKAKKVDKLALALAAEERSQAEATALLAMDERKRPYNSMAVVAAPTDEEVEAYRIKRARQEDPMAQFL